MMGLARLGARRTSSTSEPPSLTPTVETHKRTTLDRALPMPHVAAGAVVTRSAQRPHPADDARGPVSSRRTTHDAQRHPDGYEYLAPLFELRQQLRHNDPQRTKLRDALVTGHQALAHHIARRFAGRGTPYEDLVQVAIVGLINAVDRYDPDSGSGGFLAFAIPTIMGEVRHYIRDTAWALHVPRQLQERHLALTMATSEFTAAHGRTLRPRELATLLGLSTQCVTEALDVGAVYQLASLDAPTHTADNDPLGESIGHLDPALSTVEDYLSLVPALKALPERERRIIMLRYFQEQTQSQIAQSVGVSQMHVSRLIDSALLQLRRLLSQQTSSTPHHRTSPPAVD